MPLDVANYGQNVVVGSSAHMDTEKADSDRYKHTYTDIEKHRQLRFGLMFGVST